ncbi:Na/Pi cotransporter family protein [Desulfitispora alkaliphila]|uniref:Na/Pi cotransporter family protein n=1 Tax=Desulfitispora alkaliphila TaxID=622674 RepID=UPI003D1E93C0
MGLLLFIIGMQLISRGLKLLSFFRVERIIRNITYSPTMGLITGTVTTAILQSSSAVTVITIGLVNSGLMSFYQSIGIILGTNIGTCFTAFLFAYSIVDYYWIFLLTGALLSLSKKLRYNSLGVATFGLGLVFLGFYCLTVGVAPIKESPDLLQIISKMSNNNISAVIAGTLFSAIVQSSSATTVVVLALSQENLISLSAGIGIILGSNIGTCVTAVIAIIGANRAAKKVALAHVLLNVLGVAAFIPFINLYSNFLMTIFTDLSMQIIWGQLIFNILCSLLILPFVRPFAKVVEYIAKK